MNKTTVGFLFVILAFSTGVRAQPASDAGALPPASPLMVPSAGALGSDGGKAKQPDSARSARELQALREGLVVKEKELAGLRHKWSVAKGRVPTQKELLEFEKKRASGKATLEDNPYINKNPNSSPGRARKAYYEKLEEVGRDRERLRQLEREATSAR